MVKAVHPGSREYDVIGTLSRPPLRDDPMNHTIRESFLYLTAVCSGTYFLFLSCAGSLWGAQRPHRLHCDGGMVITFNT